MKKFRIYYAVAGFGVFTDTYDAPNIDNAISQAKYMLETCRGFKVLEKRTREDKTNVISNGIW